MTEHEAYLDWLASLKPGKEVAIRDRLHAVRFADVERLTDRLIIVEGGWRFRRSTGYATGGGTWPRLERITDASRDEIEHRELGDWLRSLEQRRRITVSLAVLRAMKKAHDEAVAAEASSP